MVWHANEGLSAQQRPRSGHKPLTEVMVRRPLRERTNEVVLHLFPEGKEIVRSLAATELKALVLPALGQAELVLPDNSGCGSARRLARSSPPRSPPFGQPRARPRPPCAFR